MPKKLKIESRLCELNSIYILFRPREFCLIRNLTPILRRQLKADAFQSFEDCK